MTTQATRIVCISDTHSLHGDLRLPLGDVLVHAGDFSSYGRPEELEAFATWLCKQPFAHKVVIAGNHDWLFEEDNARARSIFAQHCPDANYLQDSGVEIRGLRFWGSPWQPRFFDWAFNLDKGPRIAEKWALIPSDTEILITHGPPNGILDRTQRGDAAGCEALSDALRLRLRPRLHVFGHIHEGHGLLERDGVTYINACTCTLDYKPTNPPIVHEVVARAPI